MSSQKVCDGCGHTAPSSDARGDWARIYVPDDFLLWARRRDDDAPKSPEFDLCPACFSKVQSLLTVFDCGTAAVDQ